MAQSVQAGSVSCGHDEIYEQFLESNPGYITKRNETDKLAAKFSGNEASAIALPDYITIPVVFHVLYNASNASTNVSDSELYLQLEKINQDFARLNSDTTNTFAVWKSIAADTKFRFCLAVTDPNGNPSNGITRTLTTKTQFNQNNNDVFDPATGGIQIWDPSSYLNIIVVPGVKNIAGKDVLGYAKMPAQAIPTQDGVIIKWTTTPSGLGGRTAVHQIGHYLGLYHLWGASGACTSTDYVSDTPVQYGPNSGCPSFPSISCSNGPNGDLFQNYMDNVSDNCMNLFTTGQKNRMRSFFNSGGVREPLLSSVKVSAPPAPLITSTKGYALCTGDSTVLTASSPGALNYLWSTGATSKSIVVKTAGTYTVTASNLIGTSGATQVTINISGCPAPTTGFTVTNITLTGAKVNWTTVPCAIQYSIQYRKTGTTAWTTKTAGSNIGYKTLNGLTAATQYDWRVKSICSLSPAVSSAYSAIQQFITKGTGTEITDYEYWFDNNYASKTVISTGGSIANFNLTGSLPTNNLSTGLHQFHIHFRTGNNKWSSVLSSYITKMPVTTGINKIKSYEYWFDNNYAAKISVNVTNQANYNLNTALATTGLDNGFHLFRIRFKDSRDSWSEVFSSYITKQPSGNAISAYEYWFDNNYAARNTVVVTSQQNFNLTGSLPTSGLSNGMHALHVRFKDAATWSAVYSQYVIKISQTAGNNKITNYEYWFDNDYPGKVSQAITPQSTFIFISSLSTSGLSIGNHDFHIRFKSSNKFWSVVLSQQFNKPVLRLTDENVSADLSNLKFNNDVEDYFVYPNPTTGTYTVIVNAIDDYDQCKLEIYNSLNQCVENRPVQLTKGINQFIGELTNLAPGIYFIRITAGNSFYNMKLVKD